MMVAGKQSGAFLNMLLLSHFSRAKDCADTNCCFTLYPPATCRHALTLPAHQLAPALCL